jgi:ATP-dependent DNA helicase RecG
MEDDMFGVGARCLKSSSEHLPGNSEHLDTLQKIAEPVRSLRKTPKEVVVTAILLLCEGRYLMLEDLADLLNRSKDSLRNHYINPLLDSGRLEAKYRNIRNHPR